MPLGDLSDRATRKCDQLCPETPATIEPHVSLTLRQAGCDSHQFLACAESFNRHWPPLNRAHATTHQSKNVMVYFHRIKFHLLLILSLALFAAQLPAADDFTQLPDPDGKLADVNQPVKVFILLGQSNMLGTDATPTGDEKQGKQS